MLYNAFPLIYAVSYLVMAIGGTFLSIFVSLNRPLDPVKKSFSRYLFVVSWWGLFSVPMIFAPSEFWGTFWDRLCLMGLVFIPVGFINFNFSFLGISDKYRRFIRVNYLISFFFFFANFTGYFLPSTSPRFGLNYFTDPGPLYYLFFVYFVLISILGVATFFFGYIGSKGNRRRQLFNLFWSSLLGYSLGGLNYFIVFNVPPAFFGVLGNLGIIFHMVVYAYTITKQRLMDISVVISRAVAEILAVVFHGTIYLLLVWLYHTNVSAAIDWPFLVGTVLYGILVGQTHQNLRLFFQTTSDKLFLKGKYDYYKSLADASSRVGEKLSLEHILQVLYDTFSNVVEIANPQVYLPENFAESEASKNYMVYRKTTYQPDKNAGVIDFTSELAKKLTVSRQPLYDVKELNAAMVIPCLVEERLIGFFALGPKLSEEHYTYEDIHLLETLASQAAIALDHTRSYEKIRVELETAERQLERSQRLASIGTLIAGVTHEIRNPLTVIRAETERLINQPRDIDYLKNYQELLIKHITRIEGIVQRMLGMAKEKPKREAEININDQIEQVLSIYKADSVATVFKLDGITIRPELAKEKLMIKGDPEEIQEVFVNLVQNAIEAMGQGGTLTIKTYQQGGRPVAEITDTGKGISPELKEKIFDPFFSTRHEGVGLGLSIAYRIVREHGGDIQVSSEVGKGTTFKVLF